MANATLIKPETVTPTPQVGLIYFPEKESHIGSASVGNADPVRMLEIPVVVGRFAQAAGILPNNQPNMLEMPVFEMIRLFVGSQFVDGDLWAKAKGNPLIQSRINQGAILEFDIVDPQKAGKLQALKDNNAAEFVANCWDEARLEGWLLDEARPAIRTQIAARLAELKGDNP
jgi:hypothetical protein